MFVNCFYGGAIFQSVALKFFSKLQVFKKNSFFFYINHLQDCYKFLIVFCSSQFPSLMQV